MKKSLIALIIIGLTGCQTTGTIDPLRSVVDVKREKGDDVEYKSDLKADNGIICRELQGQVGIDAISGAGRGVRCLAVGNGKLPGCMQWDHPGFSFKSDGCDEAADLTPELQEALKLLNQSIEDLNKDNQLRNNELMDILSK